MSEALRAWADQAPPAYVPPPFETSPELDPYMKPMRDLLAGRPDLDGIATGALVFHPATLPTAEPKLLIIQRASHDSMPDRWEVPGGACDEEDRTVLDGAARELWEEAGLVAGRVRGRVGEEMVFLTRRGRRVGKVSFLVDVRVEEGKGEEVEVRLDPNEHQAFLWVAEGECRAGRCGETTLEFTTGAQERTILEAFRIVKEEEEGQIQREVAE